METSLSVPQYWWIKGKKPINDEEDIPSLGLTSKRNIIPDSFSKRSELDDVGDAESDIGSIIEEINKLAAKSPLGPYENNIGDRSIEDIMKEAEQVFIDSSKSFEQLSVRSKTSANLSRSFNDTPSLKSASPLPLDNSAISDDKNNEYYSDDFSDEDVSPEGIKMQSCENLQLYMPAITLLESDSDVPKSVKNDVEEDISTKDICETINDDKKEILHPIPKTSSQTNFFIKSIPSMDIELEKTLEHLKDAKENNNVLQIQLSNLNQSYKLLKVAHDESLESNKKLNSRILECETLLEQYKIELESTRENFNKILENESSLNKLLEIEKIQLKSAKLQNEKDAKCILDLNRQVKEMERIIARKHPDSVSALIVAAKNDEVDNNMTTKRFLEERIKTLENEAIQRDQQSSKIFLEVQEKFTEMKTKYESHIEDLELHVNDLKEQLKQKSDTFEVYTQTIFDNQEIPAKETKNASSQTTYISQQTVQKHHQPFKKTEKNDHKEDAHLLATIRGLQADLVNKDKTINKLQKELDETKKTIRRLQKEREGSLKYLPDKKEFRSHPEKLVDAVQCNCRQVEDLEQELKVLKSERDKIKAQLCRIEGDYQQLKTKRLFDLSALQQAHETEIATYINNITPLQKQLEIQQRTMSLLEEQLNLAKLKALENASSTSKPNENVEDSYRTHDKNSTIQKLPGQRNINCPQCMLRQQQLIMYKTELDELLATVEALS